MAGFHTSVVKAAQFRTDFKWLHTNMHSTWTVFINDLDDGMKCIFSKFVHDLKMGEPLLFRTTWTS